ncbi:MAG: hypothetical protein AAGD25_32860 [Cyanobacteria bacterium P01_F01_bin.150]
MAIESKGPVYFVAATASNMAIAQASCMSQLRYSLKKAIASHGLK